MTATREFHLAARPQGWPTSDTFRLVEVELPDPGPDEVLVRNLYLSVDPYMRGRMNDAKSYVPAFQVDQALDGGAVGEVVSSNSPDLSPGQVVLHNFGWREHVVAKARGFRVVDPDAAPSLSAYLGVLGTTGFTAYVGLLDVAGFKEGDSVFVSGAAGAVGSVAGQIAKLRGASRVVGSAGSPEKVAYLRELGFDAAFNYKDGRVASLLKQAAPDGITVYFDNVGGEHLEAAISRLRPHGRVALCGAISAYNADAPMPGPNNLGLAVGKRLHLRGFIVFDHNDRLPAFIADMSGWLRAGQIRADETIVDGLDSAPDAFLGLLRGENTGKMIVRLPTS
jgi:NADPH-dependent curcumin reductase CurA